MARSQKFSMKDFPAPDGLFQTQSVGRVEKGLLSISMQGPQGIGFLRAKISLNPDLTSLHNLLFRVKSDTCLSTECRIIC